MKTPIDLDKIKQIDTEFENLLKTDGVMKDGILCMEKYKEANLRVAWVLKQNIADEYDDYSEQLTNNMDKIPSSPTWRRLAYASHGFLSGERDFDKIKDIGGVDCGEALMSTAIINVIKDLGDSRSPDQSVIEGYPKHENLVIKQINAYIPDVTIVAMTGSNESLKPITESIYRHFTGEPEYVIGGHSEPSSAAVAWSRVDDKIFLWAYHPSYTCLSDKDYFDGLMNAYDSAW